MYLEQIHVRNLLSFEDILLSFGKYNVIVGPNNSGKTNLLRILDMISKNGRLDFFQLQRRLKLNPDEPTEITLTVRMEESEALMIFQSIFGTEEIKAEIHERARTIDVIVVWNGAAQDTLPPKFTMFRFHNGFTVLLTTDGHIAFDSLAYSDEKLDHAMEVWQVDNTYINLTEFTKNRGSKRYPTLKDKLPFISTAVSEESNTSGILGCAFATEIPLHIKNDGNSVTPISLLVREQGTNPGTVTLGSLFGMIFAKSFVLVNEIHPRPEELSTSLAAMRNRHPEKYDELRDTFEEITNGIKVQVRQYNDSNEQIWFVEGSRECTIGDSASGHQALTNILYLLLNKPSGLFAIDEPEIHFHPLMISHLHERLREMSKQKNNQIIIATHSPKFVTYEQARQKNDTRLIMMTRLNASTNIHANSSLSPLKIKPHLFNPEIFFGRCTMMVEGSSDYFTMKAISDFYGRLFEKCGIVLMHCDGKYNLPAFVDLHEKFQIPHHGMADSDYGGKTTNITKLSGDLENDLKSMGVRDNKSKAKDGVYLEVMDFLENVADKRWKQSGVGIAFTSVIHKAGGSIPD